MTLFPAASQLLETLSIALDLETTGLNPERDAIIEVGAVKFRGREVVDTFQTLVNPLQSIPSFVVRLTGITPGEVNAAPSFSSIAPDLLLFLGDMPLVGHSLAFDLAFLTQAGLRLPNPHYDTRDLAWTLIPRAADYTLRGLARSLGLDHANPHRALGDAVACQRLFVALVERAQEADPGVRAALASLSARSPWTLRSLWRGIAASPAAADSTSATGLLGLDPEELTSRVGRSTSLGTARAGQRPDEEEVTPYLGPEGSLSRILPRYESRPQQDQMARAISLALDQGHHLVVEAGTGVGKSIAYLLPALLFSRRNNKRVVVSTNTLNLQEQLVSQDLPLSIEALGHPPQVQVKEARFTPLKGRANYLCFRRWASLSQRETLDADEAKILAKTLVWLQSTTTGDRGELNLSGREGRLWERLSAGSSGDCPAATRSFCFLRTARARAEGAHVVVVNHALLLADLAAGGGRIPHYDHLIVDEAHHLEEEATRQFGSQVTPSQVDEAARALAQLLRDIRGALQGASTNALRREETMERATATEEALRLWQQRWDALAAALRLILERHQDATDGWSSSLRITRSTRTQPAWSDLEITWERFDGALGEVIRGLERLHTALETLGETAVRGDDSLTPELAGGLERLEELRHRVRVFVVQPQETTVYWMDLPNPEGPPTLNAAPLEVGATLEQKLFSQKESIVLTGATLSTQGSFDYLRERLGLPEAKELLLGSPFDYKKAALLLVPQDMPQPSDGRYQQALEEALLHVAQASRGRVLALFTSYASLQSARATLQPPLEAQGIAVLAQGTDGSPRRLVEAASENPNTLLLGTSSFWEGVDLPPELLRVVVIARLPFSVPTDPIFAARSELISDPFQKYAVPQAVIRFRQGFGRLIRRKDARGVAVVLDSRIVSRSYGASFLASLPPCTTRPVTLRGLAEEIRGWLGE